MQIKEQVVQGVQGQENAIGFILTLFFGVNY